MRAVLLARATAATFGCRRCAMSVTQRVLLSSDVYLRTLLIHGARAVVSQAKHKDDRLSRWVTGIAKRRHANVAAVALANKTARIAWAMLRTGADYDPNFAGA